MRLSDDKCDLYFLIQYSAIQITGHLSYIVVSLCDLIFVADAVRAILSESFSYPQVKVDVAKLTVQ